MKRAKIFFYIVSNVGKFITFGLGTVRSERVKSEETGVKCKRVTLNNGISQL